MVCHNLRSCHNVGSLLRTADGLGVDTVYLTGYTPYPSEKNDKRLPHIASKIDKQIQKTALGAQATVPWIHSEEIISVLQRLKVSNYTIAALEQNSSSVDLPAWTPPSAIALIVGRETKGIEETVLKKCDLTLEIPMFGKKESFNVTQAAAMALYHCRFPKS